MNEYQKIVNEQYFLQIKACAEFLPMIDREMTDEKHDKILGDAIRYAQWRCNTEAGVKS